MARYTGDFFKVGINHNHVKQVRRGIEESKHAFQLIMNLSNAELNKRLPRIEKGTQQLGGPEPYIGKVKQHGSFEPRFMSYHMIYQKVASRGDRMGSLLLTFNPRGKRTRTGRRSVRTVHKALEKGSVYRPSSRGTGPYGPRPIHPKLMDFAEKKVQPVIRQMIRDEIDRIKAKYRL